MDEYYYDYGWLWEDNKEREYRRNAGELLYRVFKYYKNGRVDNITDPIPRDDAEERCRQVKLLDPVGQQDWVDDWKERAQEMKEIRNEYLTAKGRL